MTGMTTDTANAYEPNGFTASMVAVNEPRALTNDLDVDACVIGGGLAGLTIARALALTGWSVVVLEARRIGWNATGRSIGLVTPGFAVPVERMVARVGLDHAKRLWALSAAGVERIRESLADGVAPGVAQVDGHLVVYPDGDATVAGTAGRLREDFGAELEAWPAERVQAALAGKAHGPALYFPGAFRLHALNYALALAGAVEKAGGRIFEGTRALAIDSDGVRKRVQTTGGRVRAARIVLATGDEGGPLHPLLDATVMTLARPTALTVPLGERLAQALPFAGVVERAASPAVRYHADGDRLLWQGALTTARNAGWGTALRLRAQMRRAHPSLGRPAIAQTWLAPIASTVHGMPQIGELAPGLWVAAAFGDHAINTTAMAADLIARGIRDGDDRWRLFTPYGLVWTGGKAGRTVVALALKGAAATGWLRRQFPRRAPPVGTPAAEPVPAPIAAPASMGTTATIAFTAPAAVTARSIVALTAKVEASIQPRPAKLEPSSAPAAEPLPVRADEQAAAPATASAPEHAASSAEPTVDAQPAELPPGDGEPGVDAPAVSAADPDPGPQASAGVDPAATSKTETAPVKKKRQRAKAKSTAAAPGDDSAAAPRPIRGNRKRPVRLPASEAAKVSQKRRSPKARTNDQGPPLPAPALVANPPPNGEPS
jgi:glycine/D-amino acid oxidase-like deaminating enzyme